MFRIPTSSQWVLAIVIAAIMAIFATLIGFATGSENIQFMVNITAISGFCSAVLMAAIPPKGNGSCSSNSSEQPAKTIYVGNLAFKANSEQVRGLFSQYGNVHTVRIMTDRLTRRPRGFAFVEMEGAGADRAISVLDGHEFFGRPLKVNEGHTRKPNQFEADQDEQQNS